MSRRAINAVETGRFDPSLPLARCFGMKVEEMFQLDEEGAEDKA